LFDKSIGPLCHSDGCGARIRFRDSVLPRDLISMAERRQREYRVYFGQFERRSKTTAAAFAILGMVFGVQLSASGEEAAEGRRATWESLALRMSG
jgi:hypothetical protein